MIVKGKTKSGYQFSVDSRVKDDRRFTRAVISMQYGKDKQEQVEAVYDLERLLLGTDEEVAKLEEAIAKKNDGFCSNQEFYAEINEIIEALNAKN
jgi:hypothetical protein